MIIRSFYKKSIALMMSLILLLSVMPISLALTLRDIDGHWAQGYIDDMVALKIIEGFPEDNTFRPSNTVLRDQYIKMVVTANNLPVENSTTGYWALPYIKAAQNAGYIDPSYFGSPDRSNYAIEITREEMASILVKSYLAENPAPTNEEIARASKTLSDFNTVSTRFLDDVVIAVALGYINGFPDGTFAPKENATRAQSAKVIHNHLVKTDRLNGTTAITPPPTALKTAFAVSSIEIGDTSSAVIQRHGQPLRKDHSPWGFQWWIYHNNFKDYFAIGIQNDKVVGLYTASDVLKSETGLAIGQTKPQVTRALGSPVKSIIKGKNEYLKENNNETATYLYKNTYITTHFDVHNGGRLLSATLIDATVERNMDSLYGMTSEGVRLAYERQVFDLANVFRVNNNKAPFKFARDASDVAYKHSLDMATRNFFDHTNPSGERPFDRLLKGGVNFSIAAENIAAGYFNAFDAHAAWVNSKGHRDNLLRDIEFLGVGVHLGGPYTTYFTQNMYSR